MQYKKPLLLFYLLVLASLGVIIAAEPPQQQQLCPQNINSNTKCCKVPQAHKLPSPQRTIAEGLARYKA